LVGRVGGAGGQVEEEGFLRRYRVVLLYPLDRVIHQVRSQVVDSIVSGGRFDRCGVAIQDWLPLADCGAQKTVEVFEAQSGGPAVERPGRFTSHTRVLCPLPNAAAL